MLWEHELTGVFTAFSSSPKLPRAFLFKDVRAKFSNIDFFLKILPLKDDELAMSEM